MIGAAGGIHVDRTAAARSPTDRPEGQQPDAVMARTSRDDDNRRDAERRRRRRRTSGRPGGRRATDAPAGAGEGVAREAAAAQQVLLHRVPATEGSGVWLT
jgi:hypothetical protein